MEVPDGAKAEHYLRHVSYYRLRAYWLPFEVPPAVEGDHSFRPGTTFDDVLALYVFDRHLRLLVMDAIERVEVSLRGNWALHLALKYGPHGYVARALYRDMAHYQRACNTLAEEVRRSKDAFIEHYRSKYGNPEHPPVWMAAEVMSLGLLSKWYGNLKARADRQAIARAYGLDETIMVSVAHHLAYVRNICAHHGRLWNKQFTVTMKLPESPGNLALALTPTSNRRLYNTLAMLGYLVGIVAPGSGWKAELVRLMANDLPLTPGAMGFPGEWARQPFWE